MVTIRAIKNRISNFHYCYNRECLGQMPLAMIPQFLASKSCSLKDFAYALTVKAPDENWKYKTVTAANGSVFVIDVKDVFGSFTRKIRRYEKNVNYRYQSIAKEIY